MCAIAGAINYQKYDLLKIQNSLLHRGSDELSIYREGNSALIHNRLSIQDIEEGHQPIHYKKFSLIFNGEIYNHIKLRDELREFNFKTNSDSETLLYLYIKYREFMFDMIDGMFAIAILDRDKNRLILARDRAGKKPIYYYRDSDSLLFASELNALKSEIDLRVDEDAIYSYLRTGLFFGVTTPYQNVIEVNSGEYIEIDTRDLTIKTDRFFNLLSIYKSPKSELSLSDTISKVDSLLTKSIESRLLSSDLEVGAFLSGGIDSSLIVAIASKFKEKLKTFTVKFSNGYDESNLAKLTANRYSTEHTEIDISENLKDDIEKILLNYGKPFMDSSAIPSYYVSREAKKYVTVILNGDGADELFGGYRRYVASSLISIAKNFSFLNKLLPKAHDKQSLYSNIQRLLTISKKSGLDFYLSSTTDIFEDCFEFQDNRVLKELELFIDRVNRSSLSSLDKMLYLDFEILLFSDLLIKMDIASMSNTLEARSPFLSKYLLEFIPTLKDEFKVNRTTSKYILRELGKRYLDSELINQPKRGFEVPLKSWVDFELRENIFDSLSSGCYSEKFVDRNFIEKLLKREIDTSDEKRAKMLWSMYSLEIWRDSLN